MTSPGKCHCIRPPVSANWHVSKSGSDSSLGTVLSGGFKGMVLRFLKKILPGCRRPICVSEGQREDSPWSALSSERSQEDRSGAGGLCWQGPRVCPLSRLSILSEAQEGLGHPRDAI